MEVFLKTDRLILRRFTDADVDNLVELDADPDVMRYISGGTQTPREEIEQDVLPRFLWYYDTFAGWGKGYATEGSRALIDKAFTDLGASRVFAETMVVNTASRGVMEKQECDWSARSMQTGQSGSPATSTATSNTPSPAMSGRRIRATQLVSVLC